MPLALGALAGVLCERSGVINIAIEGMMLTAAFTGAIVGSAAGNLVGRSHRGGWRSARCSAGCWPCFDPLPGRPDHRRHGHQHLGPRDHQLPVARRSLPSTRT